MLHKIERTLTVPGNALSAVEEQPGKVCAGVQMAERDELFQFLCGGAALNLGVEK
jgi:hypothetical protein